ncbi:MAG: rhodanese-like domain-containing protein [Flavobacteriia bacterium]|jgi:rhodanese-related sulfurtransferase
MRLISAFELHEAIRNGHDFEIIDVREPYEYSSCNIGSIHIPMGEVCDRIAELPKDKNIVIMCRSGKRAEAVANLLMTDFSMSNVYILDGGILAWKDQVDNTLDLD